MRKQLSLLLDLIRLMDIELYEHFGKLKKKKKKKKKKKRERNIFKA